MSFHFVECSLLSLPEADFACVRPIVALLTYEPGNLSTYESLSVQSTLNLQAGDQIWLQIDFIATGTYLIGSYHTHFSGTLLEENVAQ